MRERHYSCPNCGAPIKSHKCEYCDTVFNQGAIDYEEVMNQLYSYRIAELEHQVRKAEISMSNANLSAYLLQQLERMTCNIATDIRTATTETNNHTIYY